MIIRCIDDNEKQIPSVGVGDLFDVIEVIDDPELGRLFVIRSPLTRKKIAIKASRFEEVKTAVDTHLVVR